MNSNNVKRSAKVLALALLASAIAATAAMAGTYGRSRGGDPNYSAMATSEVR